MPYDEFQFTTFLTWFGCHSSVLIHHDFFTELKSENPVSTTKCLTGYSNVQQCVTMYTHSIACNNAQQGTTMHSNAHIDVI